MSPYQLRHACFILRHGGVIAYPTEAVYGLGCDPLNFAAVHQLLTLKQRSVNAGLILVASNIQQLLPYADENYLTSPELQSTWPGPVTWVVPARPDVPVWIRGDHTCVAVRISAHPLIQQLCTQYGGALISTSANPNQRSPAKTVLRLRKYFGFSLNYVLTGALGQSEKPTQIRRADNGAILRQ